METFEYGDQEISSKEIMFAVASMVVGVGILTLPRSVAEATQASDGWISIAIAGLAAICLAWTAAKLSSLFPKMQFFQYASLIVSKPVSYILTLILFANFLLLAGYEVRSLANIAKQYLFSETPVEVVALIFLLIVVYAIAGSRVGVLRLNLLFFPIVLGIVLMLLLFSIGFMKFENLKPFFITNWSGIAMGAKEGISSLLGFEIILFYISFMNRPKEAPKAAVIGVALPVILYLIIYMVVISVFSIEATRNVYYPTIELAKEIELPGQFFERLESLFFVIWIMTLFNTTSMALDVSVMALESLTSSMKKTTLIWILTPVVYIIAMMPKDAVEYEAFGSLVSYIGIAIIMLIPTLLLIITKLRGGKPSG